MELVGLVISGIKSKITLRKWKGNREMATTCSKDRWSFEEWRGGLVGQELQEQLSGIKVDNLGAEAEKAACMVGKTRGGQ
jgi:hypothetical protein